MKKNKIFPLAVLVALMLVTLVGCQKKTEVQVDVAKDSPKEEIVVNENSYEDGIYFAAQDSYAKSGWKYVVTISVENGKIANVDWNGVNVSAGPSKKAVDAAGQYNMVKFGKAQAEWSQQAEKVEQYLIETQDPAEINYAEDGLHTDSISGVSIKVSEFFTLAQEALENGPVGKGVYQDGSYFFANPEFSGSGWKEYVALTVINGNIVSANWSAINKNGEDKKAFDAAGKYNMVKFGKAQAEWSQQANKVEEYLLSVQDPSKATYTDDKGHTDAISGVSIKVASFFTLADSALKAGPVSLGSYKDGGYYASQEEFNKGWKEYVSLLVKNGHIVSAYWSALNEAGEDKKAVDMDGNYGMVAKGGAQSNWYEQAALAEQYLLKTQDASAISYKEDGTHTDDIAGVSIRVNSFYELVDKAFSNGVVKVE